jgi:hypothetical protein
MQINPSVVFTLRAKGGVVPPGVFNLPHSCEHQIKYCTIQTILPTTSLPIKTSQHLVWKIQLCRTCSSPSSRTSTSPNPSSREPTKRTGDLGKFWAFKGTVSLELELTDIEFEK